MVDHVDVMASHGILKLARIRAVDVLERPVRQSPSPGDLADIGGHDLIGSEVFSQSGHQFRSDLPGSARHQNAAHA